MDDGLPGCGAKLGYAYSWLHASLHTRFSALCWPSPRQRVCVGRIKKTSPERRDVVIGLFGALKSSFASADYSLTRAITRAEHAGFPLVWGNCPTNYSLALRGPWSLSCDACSTTSILWFCPRRRRRRRRGRVNQRFVCRSGRGPDRAGPEIATTRYTLSRTIDQ